MKVINTYVDLKINQMGIPAYTPMSGAGYTRLLECENDTWFLEGEKSLKNISKENAADLIKQTRQQFSQ